MANIYLATSWRNDAYPAVLAALRAAGHEVYDFRDTNASFHWREIDVPLEVRSPWSAGELARQLAEAERGGYDISGDPFVMKCAERHDWRDWKFSDFKWVLDQPPAQQAFMNDLDALRWADTLIMLLPCGLSAHMELGWAAGRPGCRTAVLADPNDGQPFRHWRGEQAELMYLLADEICLTVDDCLAWLDDETAVVPETTPLPEATDRSEGAS